MVLQHRILGKLDTPKTNCAPPKDAAEKEQRGRVLATYRRIICLQHVNRCGLCGTTRHATLPYWHLGMRVCKYCLQENLVTDAVLEERYWIRLWNTSSPGAKNQFVDQITARVWYFKEYGTARQRAEYTHDRLDFHKALGTKNRTTWFFWRPHLEGVFDMKKMREAADEKHKAAQAIRKFARRMTTLRTLNGTTDKKRGTRMVEWSKHVPGERRASIDKLQRSLALGGASKFIPKMDHRSYRRLANFEDHVIPCIRARAQTEVLPLAKAVVYEFRTWP